MDIDIPQLKALVELLQGGGTAGLLVFGFFIMRAFRDLREKIDQSNALTGAELSRIRERLIRIEVELEYLSKHSGGTYRAVDIDKESDR